MAYAQAQQQVYQMRHAQRVQEAQGGTPGGAAQGGVQFQQLAAGPSSFPQVEYLFLYLLLVYMAAYRALI